MPLFDLRIKNSYDRDSYKLVVALLFPTNRSIGTASLCHTILKASASAEAFFLPINLDKMKKVPVRIEHRKILADIITPVSIYLKVRDIYPNSILLESSDYHSKENSFSFICMDPLAEFLVHKGESKLSLPGQDPVVEKLSPERGVVERLDEFISAFEISSREKP